jgi:hypothetical protein
MSNQLILQQLQDLLSENISIGTFVKISLGNYQGNEKELKSVYVRPIVVKRSNMLSFTYRYKTRDIFKNLDIAAGLKLVLHFINNDFKICTVFTSEKEIIIEHSKKGDLIRRERSMTAAVKPTLAHNREKRRLIQPSEKTYLQELGVTDNEGKVFARSQDKFRQINQYIEILSSLRTYHKAG